MVAVNTSLSIHSENDFDIRNFEMSAVLGGGLRYVEADGALPSTTINL